MPSPGLVARIRRFNEAVGRLEIISSLGRERYFSDPFVRDSAERNLQVAIESLLDVGVFIITKKGWPTPETYAEISDILSSKGILSKEDGRILASMAGLRNILVYSYADIDHDTIFSLLGRLGDLRRIMRAMLEFLEGEGIDP